MKVRDVLADLIAEQAALDEVVAPLTPEQWTLPTPSPGWTVADQIGHLTYFDGTARQAITDPDAFTDGIAELLEAMGTGDDPTLVAARSKAPDELLAAWRANRAALAEAATTLGEDDRVIWYGPSMGSKSFLTARLMEAWAHGQDVVDTVGGERADTDRLYHVARLGVITRNWSYLNRGMQVPQAHITVTLTAPSGDVWELGEDDGDQSIFGTASDFCLVVTQRRHVDDTGLVVDGGAARDWMLQAQAFAGAPTYYAGR